MIAPCRTPSVVGESALRKLQDARAGVAGGNAGGGALLEPRAKALPLGLREIDEALPEAGLPRGAVVEVATPGGLARATSVALAACASAQAEARLRGGDATDGAWCAWIDASGTLFAPAVARAGVDLSRLLVVTLDQGDVDRLARVAVRVASSGVFSVVVVDLAGVPGGMGHARLERWTTAVRRLALAVEKTETAVLLLTDGLAARAMPLPVALRLEIERPREERLLLRIGKDRRGRVSAPWPVEVPGARAS